MKRRFVALAGAVLCLLGFSCSESKPVKPAVATNTTVTSTNSIYEEDLMPMRYMGAMPMDSIVVDDEELNAIRKDLIR